MALVRFQAGEAGPMESRPRVSAWRLGMGSPRVRDRERVCVSRADRRRVVGAGDSLYYGTPVRRNAAGTTNWAANFLLSPLLPGGIITGHQIRPTFSVPVEARRQPNSGRSE